jgi:thiol-disulfide isomerase/thioredoxin
VISSGLIENISMPMASLIMTNRIFSFSFAGFALLVVFSLSVADLGVMAQGIKPSRALNQWIERQNELFKKFDREVSEGKAQSYEWEARTEALRQFAAERAAGYKIRDWVGEELMALATLYQIAEDYAPAAEAFRVYLASNPNARMAGGLEVHASYTRALLETGQLEEAEKALDTMFRVAESNPPNIVSRIALSKDLTIALRDRGYLEKAARQARKGYQLADAANQNEMLKSRLRENTLQDQFSLAALHIALNERMGLKKQAEEFIKLVLKYDFTNQPTMKSFFESELAIARLIGKPAPDLVAAPMIDGQLKSLSELHGKVVLLDFWAMWCSPCLAAFPHLRGFQSKYGSKGFEIIGVTRLYGRSDKEDSLSGEQELRSLQDYKARYHLSYPCTVAKLDDLTNEDRYSVISLPTIILVDRSGNVRHVKRGVGEYNKLERQIAKLIDEKK